MSLDIPRLVLDVLKWSVRWSARARISPKPSSCRRRQSGAESRPASVSGHQHIFTEMEEGKIRGRMVIDFRPKRPLLRLPCSGRSIAHSPTEMAKWIIVA